MLMRSGAGKFKLYIGNITPEDWDFHMKLNVDSILHLTQVRQHWRLQCQLPKGCLQHPHS
jgi:hypothetical protein